MNLFFGAIYGAVLGVPVAGLLWLIEKLQNIFRGNTSAHRIVDDAEPGYDSDDREAAEESIQRD